MAAMAVVLMELGRVVVRVALAERGGLAITAA
jgi:hypothetical protein